MTADTLSAFESWVLQEQARQLEAMRGTSGRDFGRACDCFVTLREVLQALLIYRRECLQHTGLAARTAPVSAGLGEWATEENRFTHGA